MGLSNFCLVVSCVCLIFHSGYRPVNTRSVAICLTCLTIFDKVDSKKIERYYRYISRESFVKKSKTDKTKVWRH